MRLKIDVDKSVPSLAAEACVQDADASVRIHALNVASWVAIGCAVHANMGPMSSCRQESWTLGAFDGPPF